MNSIDCTVRVNHLQLQVGIKIDPDTEDSYFSAENFNTVMVRIYILLTRNYITWSEYSGQNKY